MAEYTDEQIGKAMKGYARLKDLHGIYLHVTTFPDMDYSTPYARYEEARRTFLEETPKGIVALVQDELDMMQIDVAQVRKNLKRKQ